MNTFLKKLLEWIASALIKKLFDLISIAVLFTNLVLYLNLFKNALINHIGLTMLALALLFTATIVLSAYLYLAKIAIKSLQNKIRLDSEKKIINRILTDKKGLSYCANCKNLLNLKVHPKHKESCFYCDSCKAYSSPVLSTGRYIDARVFEMIQKIHPQIEITEEFLDNNQSLYMHLHFPQLLSLFPNP